MRILSIGSDRKLFIEGSEVRRRIGEYGKLAEEYHIIVFTLKSHGFDPGDFGYFILSKNIFLYPTQSYSRLFYVFDAVRIAKKIIKKKWLGNAYNALITAQDPFEAGWAGRNIKKKFRIPLQIQVHTDFLSPLFTKGSFLNFLRREIARFVIPEADCVRVVSQRIKRAMREQLHIAREKITVLPVFVDVGKVADTAPQINLKEKYPQFDFICFMASRLTKEKNIQMAIKAFKSVAKKHPKTGLLIVGEGPEREKLERKTGWAGLKDNIIFEDWSDDLVSYYKTADLFLLTSNYEGYGRSVIEAMAAGCPVVMTAVGIAGEILKNEESGLVVPVGEKKMLAEAILKIIADRSFADILISNAFRALRELSAKEKYLERMKASWMACFGVSYF